MLNKIFLVVLFFLSISVINATPLEGRKYGVEFNIPRVLTYSEKWKSMSGTFSVFNHNNKTEIAFPWLIAKYGQDDEALLTKSIDIHYRKFLDDELNGLYLSGFARLAHFDGQKYIADTQETFTHPNGNTTTGPATKDESEFRVGVGVGLGLRMFPKHKRMYWGAGLVVGRYFDQGSDFINRQKDSLPGPFSDSSAIILDVELLKFGYAF